MYSIKRGSCMSAPVFMSWRKAIKCEAYRVFCRFFTTRARMLDFIYRMTDDTYFVITFLKCNGRHCVMLPKPVKH